MKKLPRYQPASECSPSICLVVCYFGKFPAWLDVFLLSCAYNPTIDFLIFTNQIDVPKAPTNVRFVQLEPTTFEQLATERLGVEIKLRGYRKLCDFKPLYGWLFSAELSAWDYWGYTDIDVIYGDLRKFLSQHKLEAYDVFTARKEYVVGHFTLFRNSDRVSRLFKKSADIPALLQSDKLYCFDECGGQCFQALRGRLSDTSASCDSITHVVRRQMDSHLITACFASLAAEWPNLRGRLWRLRWRDGRLWNAQTGKELMYFHFHFYKRNRGYKEPQVLPGDRALEISARGITGCMVDYVSL